MYNQADFGTAAGAAVDSYDDYYARQFSPLKCGIDRHAIDYTAHIVPFLNSFILKPSFYNRTHLKSHPAFARDMLPIFTSPPQSYEGICSFLAFTAVNRSKTHCVTTKWFPDGRKLLTGTYAGELAIWNGTHFQFEDIKRLPSGGGAVTALEWSPFEDRLYAGDTQGHVVVLSPALSLLENEAFDGLTHEILDLSTSPVGRKLAACAESCTPVIWDARRTTVERYLRAEHLDSNSIRCLKWHPSLALICTGSRNNWIYLWDPRTALPVASILGHKGSLTRVSWNPNGNSLLTCSKDTLIKIWDLRTLRLQYFYRSPQNYFELSNTSSTNKTVAEPICCDWNPLHANIFAVGDSCGGLCFYALSAKDNPVCQIMGAHGNFINNERERTISSLDWNPLGHLLATSSDDKNIRFWSRSPPGTICGKILDAGLLCKVNLTGTFPYSFNGANKEVMSYLQDNECNLSFSMLGSGGVNCINGNSNTTGGNLRTGIPDVEDVVGNMLDSFVSKLKIMTERCRQLQIGEEINENEPKQQCGTIRELFQQNGSTQIVEQFPEKDQTEMCVIGDQINDKGLEGKIEIHEDIIDTRREYTDQEKDKNDRMEGTQRMDQEVFLSGSSPGAGQQPIAMHGPRPPQGTPPTTTLLMHPLPPPIGHPMVTQLYPPSRGTPMIPPPHPGATIVPGPPPPHSLPIPGVLPPTIGLPPPMHPLPMCVPPPVPIMGPMPPMNLVRPPPHPRHPLTFSTATPSSFPYMTTDAHADHLEFVPDSEIG